MDIIECRVVKTISVGVDGWKHKWMCKWTCWEDSKIQYSCPSNMPELQCPSSWNSGNWINSRFSSPSILINVSTITHGFQDLRIHASMEWHCNGVQDCRLASAMPLCRGVWYWGICFQMACGYGESLGHMHIDNNSPCIDVNWSLDRQRGMSWNWYAQTWQRDACCF